MAAPAGWTTLKHVVVISMVITAGSIIPTVIAQTGPSDQSDETSLGGQMTAVMQSSAVDLQDGVEGKMWLASLEKSNAPDRIITKRISRLRNQLRTLRNDSQTLTTARGNGSAAGIEYTAKAVTLRAKIRNLRTAINETQEVAANHGVDAARLQELRQAAGSLEGPEISAIARTLTDAGRGPAIPEPGAPPNEPNGGPGKADGGEPPNQTADNRSAAGRANSSEPADQPS